MLVIAVVLAAAATISLDTLPARANETTAND